MAIWAAVLTPGEALAVELEALGILTGATLSFPGLGRLAVRPLAPTMVVQVAKGNRLPLEFGLSQ